MKFVDFETRKRVLLIFLEVIYDVFKEMLEKKKERKKRSCFACKTALSYYNFEQNALRKGLTEENIKKIWNDDRVEILCCNCFMNNRIENFVINFKRITDFL